MLSLFKNKKSDTSNPIKIDIHSHLIPGIDDGSENFETSLQMLRAFEHLGYQKVITTPHIMHDFFNNKEDDLIKIHNDLVNKGKKDGLKIEIELAAEYYLDDHLLERLNQNNNDLLTFGDNYLLFETSFINEPFLLSEFIFKAQSQGYKPVLAHPERYAYLKNNDTLINQLLQRDVLLQININSLVGYYSKDVFKTAELLIKRGQVHFVGSDCHHIKYIEVLKEGINSKIYKKATQLKLLNNTL